MSLRARLTLTILAVMLATIMLGGVIVVWNGRRQVHTELAAALIVAKSSVLNAYRLARDQHDQSAVLIQSVAAFDGSRNIRATLLDHGHHQLAVSVPRLPAYPAPAWLVALLRPALHSIVVPFVGDTGLGREIVLEPVGLNETSEVWANISDDGVFICIFVLLSLVLIRRTVDWIMAPIIFLANGIADLRQGRRSILRAQSGPRELHAVISEFNFLVADLTAHEKQTRALEDQLARLQDEERADLSRDLHDEIGPLLFLAKIDLSALASHAAIQQDNEMSRTIAVITDSISCVQQHLRDILIRLRQHRELEFGLERAVEALMARWQESYPRKRFTLDIEGDLALVNYEASETAYRIVKEALNNSMRHAQARTVMVSLVVVADEAIEVMVSDDGVGSAIVEPPGFGIEGMQARARASGGTFTAASLPDRPGWVVRASLPLTAVHQTTLASAS